MIVSFATVGGRFVLALAAVSIVGLSGASQTALAQPPSPRVGHSLIYDEQLQRVLLLNGYFPRTAQPTEVWAWDGTRWELIPGSAPTARYVGAAVYDARRKRVVMYGGRVGHPEEVKGDTWEWDGRSWHLMADTSVGARDHHMMAYDVSRGKTVMFGGGPFPRLPGPWATDTWEWDGMKWSQVATVGPLGRVASMTYDSKRKQVLLFGGVGVPPGAGQPQPLYGDTWIWNGRQWRSVSGGGPPPRAASSMVFDSQAGVVLLYGGGGSGNESFGDMWQWDGTQWTEIHLTGPTPGRRNAHAMAYDAARGRTVLFGGRGCDEGGECSVRNDTWEWSGTRWEQVN